MQHTQNILVVSSAILVIVLGTLNWRPLAISFSSIFQPQKKQLYSKSRIKQYMLSCLALSAICAVYNLAFRPSTSLFIQATLFDIITVAIGLFGIIVYQGTSNDS